MIQSNNDKHHERKVAITIILFIFYMVSWRYYGSLEFFLKVQSHFNPNIEFIHSELFVAFAHFFSTSFWFAILPLITFKFLWGNWLAASFFKIPTFKQIWGLLVIPITLFFIFMSFNASFDPSFRSQYPFSTFGKHSVGNFLFYSCFYALFYYVPWELFFRGQIQFLIRKNYGFYAALICQLLPSVLVHIGKPSGEIYGAIIAGIYWSFVAEKTESILIPLFMHILVGVSLDMFLFIV